jgi:CheY-like chemotaxis protein
MDEYVSSEETQHLRAELKRERASRAAAEAANQANDEMLNSISHKLRNPLNTMMLWSQVLREQPGDPAMVTRALDGLDQAARLQIRMIDTLLDMSRISLGRLRLEVEDVPLRPIVESAVEASRPLAGTKAITLEMDLAAGLIAVSGDATRLGQVIWHLLSNAIRHTPRGGHVWIRLSRSGGAARVTVRDSGPGIEPSRLSTIFDLHHASAGGGASPDDAGGLGLALTRHIVELHGGMVRAESSGYGEGATFALELPLLGSGRPAVVDRSAEAGVIGAGAPIPVSLGGLRILIVEDEPSARDSMRIILQRCGAEVAAVGSARQALETLAEGRFDVLVSDIAMPGGDGYELLRRVRAMAPEDGGQIPAVAVTAQAGPESRSRAIAEGFQLYLNKPVDAAHLVRLVTALGGRARAG